MECMARGEYNKKKGRWSRRVLHFIILTNGPTRNNAVRGNRESASSRGWHLADVCVRLPPGRRGRGERRAQQGVESARRGGDHQRHGCQRVCARARLSVRGATTRRACAHVRVGAGVLPARPRRARRAGKRGATRTHMELSRRERASARACSVRILPPGCVGGVCGVRHAVCARHGAIECERASLRRRPLPLPHIRLERGYIRHAGRA